MPRLLELWSSLDSRIGALYIRAIEEHQVGVDFVVTFHRSLLDAIRSGDPAVARQAVLDHYVRFNDAQLTRADALEHAIQTVAAADR
jgi:DNA-binding FadR family transcriptional regulator